MYSACACMMVQKLQFWFRVTIRDDVNVSHINVNGTILYILRGREREIERERDKEKKRKTETETERQRKERERERERS